MENTSMDLRKAIYGNVEKKKKIDNKHISVYRVTDLLKFYEVAFLVHIVKVCFVIKKQSLCLYSSVYV